LPISTPALAAKARTATMARGPRGSLSAAYESDSQRCCRSMEEIHATDGSRSSVSISQERIEDSTAVPSIGTTGEGARAGGVSRLRSAGDAEAPAEAQCFGVFTGPGAEATLRTVQRRHRATDGRRTRDLVAEDYQAGGRSRRTTPATPRRIAGTFGAHSNPKM